MTQDASGRVDAHQHFWKLSRGDYGWLTQDLPKLYRDFLPEHLAPLLERSGVGRTIVVQAAPTDAETLFLLQLAESNPFIAGVVGWTDLESPHAPEAIAELARHRKLVGLRPMVQDLADDEWLLRASLNPAIAAMHREGLRFDALVKPRHLPVLRRFLEHHPDLAVVIDHGAKPSIAAGEIDVWARQMRAIARDTNAFCKLSGLATEAATGWTDATLQPYVDVLIDAFGARRLMWGSDWPVLRLAYNENDIDAAYAKWHATVMSLTTRLSSDELEWLFGATAEAFYGIA
jgi:L-fuconolactonase